MALGFGLGKSDDFYVSVFLVAFCCYGRFSRLVVVVVEAGESEQRQGNHCSQLL